MASGICSELWFNPPASPCPWLRAVWGSGAGGQRGSPLHQHPRELAAARGAHPVREEPPASPRGHITSPASPPIAPVLYSSCDTLVTSDQHLHWSHLPLSCLLGGRWAAPRGWDDPMSQGRAEQRQPNLVCRQQERRERQRLDRGLDGPTAAPQPRRSSGTSSPLRPATGRPWKGLVGQNRSLSQSSGKSHPSSRPCPASKVLSF